MRGIDHPLTIAACIALSVAGFATFMGMPMMVDGVIDAYGFTEGQGGYLASAEYLGMLTASVLVSLLVLRSPSRPLALAGLLLSILSNAASTIGTTLPVLLLLRFGSGLGCGMAYAIGVALLAGTRETVRNFMLLIFAQVLTNAVVVYSFPPLVAVWHVASVFVAYGVLLSLALVCVTGLPRGVHRAREAPADGPAGAVPPFIPWLCLLAVFLFYMMIGAYWAYIERLGLAAGFDELFVGQIVAAGILLSLIACLMAYRLSERLGQSLPLLIALAAMAVTHLLSGLAFGATAFLVGLGVVNWFWNFTDIYQLGTIAHVDPSGVFASRVQGAQMLAMTLSPSIAGVLLDRGLGYARLLVLLGAYVALAFAVYASVHVLLQRNMKAAQACS